MDERAPPQAQRHRSTAQIGPPLTYRPEIDGLRAIAVLSVLLFHAEPAFLPGGYLGVDVFFVISGYLITSILLAECESGRFSFATFYERRARRILPALLATITMSAPFALWLLLPSELEAFGGSVVAASLFFANIFFWNESGYFQRAAELMPLLHTWSLAIEEQFYFLFPPLLLLLARAPRAILPVLLVAAILGSVWVVEHLRDSGVVSGSSLFFLTPFRAWELSVGALLAAGERHGRVNGRHSVNRLAGWVAFVALLVCFTQFDERAAHPGWVTAIPVAATALLLWCVRGPRGAGVVLSLPPVVWVGLISYSLYLVHQPVFAFARKAFGAELAETQIALLLALSVGLALLSYWLVERPFRERSANGGHAISTRRVVTWLGAITVVQVAFGAGLAVTGGLPERYAAHNRALAMTNPVESGRYTRARFNARLGQPFADEGRRVLLIGDSFAEDLHNVIREHDDSVRLTISTHRISSRCGVLWVEQDLTTLIDPIDRGRCTQRSRDQRFASLERLEEADVVVLAARWRPWQVGFIEETVRRVRAVTPATVLVATRKGVGATRPEDFMDTPPETRASLRQPPAEAVRRVNAQLRELDIDLIDIDAALCPDGACRLFDGDGRLLMYDGEHLSPAGARFLGAQATLLDSL
ncbi:MAG: acyltransferase family protein [Pseudomonadota bacterium]